jgi:hypothetical protein
MNYTSLSDLSFTPTKPTRIPIQTVVPLVESFTFQTDQQVQPNQPQSNQPQPKACSQYGMGNITLGPGEIYTGTPWCQIGIVMNENRTHLNNIFILEARYINNLWAFRVKDPLIGVYIYLDTIGNGQNGAYRSNDMLSVPGKDGLWKVQVQVQYQQTLNIP